MEAVIGIVLAGLLFRSPGTRAATRGFAILAAIFGGVYDSPPLHHPLMARVWLVALLVTAAAWIVDLVRAARTDAERTTSGTSGGR